MNNLGAKQEADLDIRRRGVLIVDDDATSSSLLNTLVIKAGYPIISRVTNGYDAIQKIACCSPSVMLLDLDMPRMEGFATMRQVCKRYPEVLVLVVSMLNPKLYAQRCMRLGAKGFLDKGAGLALLPSAIEQVSQGRMMFPDLSSFPETLAHTLSDNELVTLRCLARGNDVSTVSLALNISRARVLLVIRGLQAKLGVATVEALVSYGRRSGLG